MMNELQLDEGISEYVKVLIENKVETFQSCEGGAGHPFPEPTICFFGDRLEGLRVLYISLKNNLPVYTVRRCYSVQDSELQSPYWEIVFRSTSSGKTSVDTDTGFFKAD